MKPDNHVDPPNPAVLVLTPPNKERFWQEVGQGVAWAKYVWSGPTPTVVVETNNVYPGIQFSAQSIYEGIVEAVGRLKIPGIKVGRQAIHETGPFSPFREYLQIRRELSEFLVCAAPVGASYFVTVRTIDRFRHVKWFHYLILAAFLAGIAVVAMGAFGFTGAEVFVVLLIALAWSLMRFASYETASWLGEKLPEIPVIGAVFMRWFRPDTYFRQDLHSAFLALAGSAIAGVITGMDPTQPVRPATETHGGPILKDLHQPG